MQILLLTIIIFKRNKRHKTTELIYLSSMVKMRFFHFNTKTPSFSNNGNSSPSSSTTSSSTTLTFIDAAETMIQKWNTETSAYAKVTSLFYNDKTEAMQYIQHVNQLQKAMHSLLALNPSSEKLILAQKLMQMAMKRLQKEFHQILSMNRAHLDSESVSTVGSSRTSFSYDDGGTLEDDLRAAGDSISEVELVSSNAVADLQSIADCMVSNGYAKECVSVYTSVRKSIVNESIYRLNVEELSFSKVNKLDWEVLDLKIKSWLEAVRISVRTLFAGERILCDRVFINASNSIREACFAEISRTGATLLFRFGELVANTKKTSPEKIFRVLEMYAAITALLPDIESIFSLGSTAAVKSQAYNLQLLLIEFIRTTLVEFESGILKDSSRSPKNFGGVHSLTTRTMQYISSLTDYNNVLSEIFSDVPPPSKSTLPETYLYSPKSDDVTIPSSGFSVLMAWLILVLLCKIDGISKHFKNVSLSYLFLANNLRHVLAKVRASNLHYVLGDDWVLQHNAKVKRLMANYERVAWGEVFSSLPKNPTVAMSMAEARVVFMKFNMEFEKAYRKQNAIVLPEEEFREEITASLAKRITPIYCEMYDRHRNAAGTAREMSEYVIFTPKDVPNYLVNLFCMGRASSSRLSRKHSLA